MGVSLLMLDSVVNGATATTAPGSSSVVIFNNAVDNNGPLVDVNESPGAVILAGGYNGSIHIAAGKTFTPNFYVDDMQSGSNQFNVYFNSSTSTLVMGTGYGNKYTAMGSFDWHSGGNVTLQSSSSVLVGEFSGFNCYSESPVLVNCALYTGAEQYNNLGDSTFYLDNDASIMKVTGSGAAWYDGQSNNKTDVSNSSYDSYVNIGNGSSGYAYFYNDNGLSSTQVSTIAIPLYIYTTGTVYFSSDGILNDSSSSYFNFTGTFPSGQSYSGYAIYLKGGTFNMLSNSSHITVSGGYYQLSGELDVGTASPQYLYVANTASDKIYIIGGTISFFYNPPSAYGTLYVDGIVTLANATVDMNIDGSGDDTSDTIIDTDATANFTLNNNTTLNVTVHGTLTTGNTWELVQLDGSGGFSGDKQFGGTLPSGVTQGYNSTYVYLQS